MEFVVFSLFKSSFFFNSGSSPTAFIQLLRNFNIEMHEVDDDESIEIKINKKDKLYSNFIDDTWFNNSSDKINPVYLEIIK